jgi:hypothetical protein
MEKKMSRKKKKRKNKLGKPPGITYILIEGQKLNEKTNVMEPVKYSIKSGPYHCV